MSVFTHNPVRTDLPDEAAADTPSTGRGWAVAGLVAGLSGMATVVASGLVDSVYREDLQARPEGLVAALAEKVPVLLVFHTSGLLAAVALLVFGAGLHRRLTARGGRGLAPVLAVGGLAATAAVLVVATGLDTEYVFAFGEPGLVTTAEAAAYNHWIGTVPWCWVLTGLAGLAVRAAARAGAVPRWLGWTGLLGGGLTLLVGISPLQYLAGLVAPVWIVVLALGFLVGDRAFRSGR